MTTVSRCHALVPCAGSGSRAASSLPKQYVPIAGKAMVAHTLDALARVPRIASTLVVLASDDALFERHVQGFPPQGVARCGGAPRAHPVMNGRA
jgi:2-C-methyl-D-erythritol 4-phosphate cytidylyltransferase/2-C-methyl-D-erythritol 4-phosphate cytidylyltransferase/2-C-methyl-D-erythritol 2,4-cyclodiphosphate synthase